MQEDKRQTALEGRRLALALARECQPTTPLRMYFWSLSQTFRDLVREQFDDEGEIWAAYQGLIDCDSNLACRFLDAWGKEIGKVGAFIDATVNEMKARLQHPES